MKDEIDYSLIIRNVLKLTPKPKVEVDYDKINKYVEKAVTEIASPSRRLLNSGGPTTRLGELVDVNIDNATDGQTIVKSGDRWIPGTSSSGGGTWGSITGTVTDQTDLVTYVTGLPISTFTNDSGYITASSLTGYVPYTGATANVDLGAYDLNADYISIAKTSGVSTREILLQASVSDAGNDKFIIGNGTITDSRFLPAFVGYVESTNAAASLQHIGFVRSADDASDSSTVGIIDYYVARTTSATDPLNGTLSAIVNRKLYTWRNFSTVLMTMTAGGNLGIGITTPTEELDLLGTFQVKAKTGADNVWFRGINSAGTTVAEMKEASTVGGGGLLFTGVRNAAGGNGIFFAGYTPSTGNAGLEFRAYGGTVASPTALTTAPVAKFSKYNGATVDDLMTLNVNGNLGIGTSSPVRLGEISGSNATTLDAFRLTNINTATAAVVEQEFALTTTSNAQVVGASIMAGKEQSWTSTASTQDGFLAFSTALDGVTSEAMRITSAKNVGIGNTTPFSRLNVGDQPSLAFRTSFPTSTTGLSVSTSVNGIVGMLESTGASSAAGGGAFMCLYANDGAALASGDRMGGFLFGGSISSTATVNTAAWVAFTAENWTLSSGATDMVLQLTPTGTFTRSEVARFTSTGRLGIGTVSPDTNLDVEGTSTSGDIGANITNLGNGTSARARISVTSGTTNFGIYANSPSYTDISNWASKAVLYAGITTNALSFISGKSDGRIDFSVGGLDPVTNMKMTILSTGNIGIGTTAPAGNLEVSGNTAQTIFATNYSADASGSGLFGRKARGTSGSPTSPLSGDTLMGFGGSGYASGAFTASKAAIFFDTTENWSGTNQGTRIRFATTPNASTTRADVMVIDNSGYVGIGTTSPTSTFHNTGSFTGAYRAITALRTLDATDYVIDCTANSFAVTLPTAVGITGRQYIIKNSGSGSITLNTTSSQTIDGQASGAIALVQYDSYTVVSNGANWLIV